MSEIDTLRAENERLREALWVQWDYNHTEHCRREHPPHPPWPCTWPIPPVLTEEAGS